MPDEERVTIEARLVRVEEGLKFTRADVSDLKAIVSRVGWIVVLAVFGALLATVIDTV
jgi:hypothetical protein